MKTKKMITTSLFTALVCIFTIVIQIPVSLTQGYINIGDSMCILSVLLVGPWGIFSAGVGSFLADIICGYQIYAIPTLIIKSLAAFLVYISFTKLFLYNKKYLLISAILGEIVMILGYLLFDFIYYKSLVVALTASVSSVIQASVSIVLAVALYYCIHKNKYILKILK